MKVFLATSWKNEVRDSVIELLEERRFEVSTLETVKWHEVDPSYKDWTVYDFRTRSNEPGPSAYVTLTLKEVRTSDVVILLMPCGRSAHEILGYAAGLGKDTIVFIHQDLYKVPINLHRISNMLVSTTQELLEALETCHHNIEFYQHARYEKIKEGACPTCNRELQLVFINDEEMLMCPSCQTPLKKPPEEMPDEPDMDKEQEQETTTEEEGPTEAEEKEEGSVERKKERTEQAPLPHPPTKVKKKKKRKKGK